jgi:hypothetical protein
MTARQRFHDKMFIWQWWGHLEPTSPILEIDCENPVEMH